MSTDYNFTGKSVKVRKPQLRITQRLRLLTKLGTGQALTAATKTNGPAGRASQARQIAQRPLSLTSRDTCETYRLKPAFVFSKMSSALLPDTVSMVYICSNRAAWTDHNETDRNL
ncbi:hypothetical protein RRG08_052955 [Elysia crispata]|uniref:Uncharacterized protein n=1 Tax=Elysia crispata TaxID=231223 RepID=A0AAE0ZJR7_9GAST|nr:hypothetical protein RRG08_052955 [Elysia crispata]